MPPTTQTAPEGAAIDPQSLAGGERRAATQEAAESLRLADAPPPAPEPQSNVPEGSPTPASATEMPTDFGLDKPVIVPVRPADAGGGFPLPGDTLPTAPAAPVAPPAPAPPQPLADAAYPQLPQSEYAPLDDAELTRAANATPPEYAALATDKLDAEAATPEVQRSIEGLAEVGSVLAEIMTIKNTSLRLRLLSSIRSELQAFVDSIPRS